MIPILRWNQRFDKIFQSCLRTVSGSWIESSFLPLVENPSRSPAATAQIFQGISATGLNTMALGSAFIAKLHQVTGMWSRQSIYLDAWKQTLERKRCQHQK